MNVTLTVSKVGTRSFTPYAQIFSTEMMMNTRALGSKCTFTYPTGSKNEEVVVDQTFAQVEALVNASPSGAVKTVWGRFNATGGLAIGTHDILDIVTGEPLTLPDKAIVLGGLCHVTTTFTSAGADAGTIALGVPTDGAAGLKAAVAISDGSNPWDAGKTAVIPVNTAASAFGPLTAERVVQAVVAAQNLTAGVMDIMLTYTVKP